MAGMFALGGVGRAFAGSQELLRPPGGQDESRIWAACLRCDKCRSACHLGCIAEARIEDGVVNARTPVVDFHKGYCDFCNRCIEVCPTTAFSSFDPEVDKIGVAVVDVDECVAWRQGGCGKCVDACDYGAIELDDAGHPMVDADKCNGCGKCEYLCPSATFKSYSGSRKRGINVEKVIR